LKMRQREAGVAFANGREFGRQVRQLVRHASSASDQRCLR
jgi:hypothetical protein